MSIGYCPYDYNVSSPLCLVCGNAIHFPLFLFSSSYFRLKLMVSVRALALDNWIGKNKKNGPSGPTGLCKYK